MDTISIIVPVYNVEAYLAECLDSILLQSYTNWKAFLINDGSTDRSGEICESYAQKDARFEVVHQTNGGAANAKNRGLDLADGVYIAFIDSDDYVEPDWLEKAVWVAEQERADIVEFGFDKIYRNRIEVGSAKNKLKREYSAETYLAQYLENWFSSLFWTKLFRAELTRDIRFSTDRRCIDDEFYTYKVVLNAKRIIRVPDVLYHYRQRISSAVSSKKNQFQITRDALDVMIERYVLVGKYFPRLKQVFLRHGVEALFYFAGFSHDKSTVKLFRRVSRYYLLQCLRYCHDRKTLINAVRLQFISDDKLYMQQEKAIDEDRNAYYE